MARSLDCTGYTGTLTHTAGVSLALGDATAGAGNVALKLVAGMTYTLGNVNSGMSFVSTSATQQTITTGTKPLTLVRFMGAGSSYILGDSLTVGATATVDLQAGTFNTGNFACSWGLFTITTATAKTLTWGSSAIAITGNSASAVNVSGSGITFTANTAVLTFSGTSAGIASTNNWNGTSAVFSSSVSFSRLTNGPTMNNLTITGPAIKTGEFRAAANGFTITGTLTVTGNSATNRLLFASDTTGTARTITTAAVSSLSNADFQDITAAGAAGTWTGTSMGNALGNSNITFDAPATQTHTASAGGNWSDVTKWTSRVPLPQDNVVVDVGTTGTLTADMPRLGADVTFTGFAGTWAPSVGQTVYGSATLSAGMTVSNNQVTTMAGRSSKTITSAGKAWTSSAFDINAPGGTYTLTDAWSNVGGTAFSVSNGSFDTANQAMNIGTGLSLSATTTRSITLGTSVITVNATTGNAVNVNFASLTISAASATIVFATSASARTFNVVGGSLTLGTLTYTVAGSTGSLTITGANTFGTINFSDVTNARSLLFTAATTTTVTNWNVNGTVGKLMTVDSATAATHTLSKPTGTVSSDYLSVKNSLAGGGAFWYAGANSTDAGGNTGWIFTAPPLTTTNFFFMFEGAMV